MNDNQDHIPDEAGDKPQDDRLESWKRISNYLNRDIRTLRRWEKNEGLPIHRLMHESLASVYAYKSELDAWLAHRSTASGKTGRPKQATPIGKKQWPVALSAVLAVIAVGLVLKMQTDTAELPFEARDWILITQFENRTGEKVFDGTLEYALQRELSNSQYVNVVPGERINDSLALMKRPADTVIDKRIGREISLRDGGIKALMTGRLEKLGDSYILGTELVEPISGAVVASFSKTAAGEDLLATAIHNLANEVREMLGESLADIETGSVALEKVSTPSLRALQLYSQADRLFIQNKSQAHQLLLQAVEIDPGFASAHVLLGYIYKDWGSKEQSDFHFQQAMELAETTTERERYFIRSSYYSYQEFDRAKALNLLELLVRQYPDHYWANSRLEWIQRQLGQPLRALPYALRRADLRPNSFISQILTVQKILETGSEQDYSLYLERAKNLANEEWQRAWVHSLDASMAWLVGDIAKTLSLAEEFRHQATADTANDNYFLLWRAALNFIAVGRLHEAKALLAERSTPPEILVLLHLATGNISALETSLAGAELNHRTSILLARAGKPAQADIVLADPEIHNRLNAPFILSFWEGSARGELALAQGEYEVAISQFESNSTIPPMWPTAYFFLGADGLAMALAQLGKMDKAIEVLEKTSRAHRASIFWPVATLFWMNNRLKLMELYYRTGQQEKAIQIEAELRQLLSVADSDHPVLLSLDTFHAEN